MFTYLQTRRAADKIVFTRMLLVTVLWEGQLYQRHKWLSWQVIVIWQCNQTISFKDSFKDIYIAPLQGTLLRGYSHMFDVSMLAYCRSNVCILSLNTINCWTHLELCTSDGEFGFGIFIWRTGQLYKEQFKYKDTLWATYTIITLHSTVKLSTSIVYWIRENSRKLTWLRPFNAGTY